MCTPDRPEIRCPWCAGGIPLGHFVASDEEVGMDVAVCPSCARRVDLALPVEPDH